jgi:hypothetical protein
MNLIANTEFIFMLVVVLLRTDMRIILISFLQCDCFDYIFNDCLFVFQKILICVFIDTGDFEEIQKFFDRLMLNDSRLAKDRCSSLARTKKFMNEDDVIIERVSQFLIDHLESEIFSFADSLLDFRLDERRF